MRSSLNLKILLILLLCSSCLFSQTQVSKSATKDTQAVTLLQNAISLSGGSAYASIQDYAATGNISYFWAGLEVKGTVTIYSKGSGQFRLDAHLAAGTRSWAVDNGFGSLLETNGTRSTISYANALHLGSYSRALLPLTTAINDPKTSIQYLGLNLVDGTQLHKIRVELFANEDLAVMGTNATWVDYFIDQQSGQLVKISQTLHDKDTSSVNGEMELLFSDYQTVNGISLPHKITEKLCGQITSKMQLTSISLNQGLSDSMFAL